MAKIELSAENQYAGRGEGAKKTCKTFAVSDNRLTFAALNIRCKKSDEILKKQKDAFNNRKKSCRFKNLCRF